MNSNDLIKLLQALPASDRKLPIKVDTYDELKEVNCLSKCHSKVTPDTPWDVSIILDHRGWGKG